MTYIICINQITSKSPKFHTCTVQLTVILAAKKKDKDHFNCWSTRASILEHVSGTVEVGAIADYAWSSHLHVSVCIQEQGIQQHLTSLFNEIQMAGPGILQRHVV